MMHESPLICQLLKVKPRAATAASITPAPTSDTDAKEENTSGFPHGEFCRLLLLHKN